MVWVVDLALPTDFLLLTLNDSNSLEKGQSANASTFIIVTITITSTISSTTTTSTTATTAITTTPQINVVLVTCMTWACAPCTAVLQVCPPQWS